MKIAIPTWNGRVSPVMDTARQLLIVERSRGVDTSQKVTEIPAMGVSGLARFLTDLRIDVLICGAISYPLEQMLRAAGIELHPWHGGAIDEVIAAHRGGFLPREDFLLPGRRRRGRGGGRCRRGHPGMGRNTQTEEKR